MLVPNSTTKVCYRCDSDGHMQRNCQHKDTVCHGCAKRDTWPKCVVANGCTHHAKALRLTVRLKIFGGICVEDQESLQSQPFMVVLELDQVHVPMEVDTGAAVSLIAEELRTNRLFHGAP